MVTFYIVRVPGLEPGIPDLESGPLTNYDHTPMIDYLSSIYKLYIKKLKKFLKNVKNLMKNLDKYSINKIFLYDGID